MRNLNLYRTGIRPLLFSGLKADPEWLHQQAIRSLSWVSQTRGRPPGRWLNAQLQQSYCFRHAALRQTLWGIQFSNPLGLAAGFDKDGQVADLWSSFGFGFAELGTVTLHAQPGNPRPRLFRLPQDEAALNRMGFNNQGAAAMAVRLEALVNLHKQTGADPMLIPANHRFAIPLGINLGKSKVTPLEEAAMDYLGSFRLLQDWGNYFVVNVSSPNTPGLRSLQATDQLAPILQALQQENIHNKPILVKIAPDLEWEAIAAVLDLAKAYGLSGIIATNTTIRREGLKTELLTATGNAVADEAGGISGAPVRDRATEVIRFIYRHTAGQLPIIGVGGIFTAEHAWEKIVAGASLIQVYTGWIYEGPEMARQVLKGLVQKLEEHQLDHISEAVGLEHAVTVGDRPITPSP